jgi:pimeloyl-ACP methyl ester carboxylesterase
MMDDTEIIGRYLAVTVLGVEYRVYFESAGQGTPVMLQHTAGADGRQWRHLLADRELTQRYRFIAHDLPFHGKSVPPAETAWWESEYQLSREFFLDFIIQFKAALGIGGDAIFMGSSMGGHIAADLALDHPGAFRAVIAVQGALATHDVDSFVEYLWHPRVSNELRGAIMFGMMAPQSPEKWRRETAWVYSQGGPPVYHGDLIYFFRGHDLQADAARIDTSQTAVYVMSGEYDWSATPALCKALADAISGAHYVPMKNLGHFPMSEHPAEFRKYLEPVLDEIVNGV